MYVLLSVKENRQTVQITVRNKESVQVVALFKSVCKHCMKNEIVHFSCRGN